MRITSRIGSSVPPPVTARPAPVVSSRSVVDTMTVTGKPLCRPSFGSPNRPRTRALSASCCRWAGVRESLVADSSSGSPATQGASSSGLHMPGAANRASHASRLARNSGEAQSFPRLIPSARWPHQVKPRWRARSASENFPSGLMRNAHWCATFSSWSGRNSVAWWARNRSASSTARTGVVSGRSRTNFSITRRCCPSSMPSRHTPAVAGNSGGNSWPVSVRRGDSCLASRSRRHASA